MFRYLTRDIFNGFVFILILFSIGEIVALILLRIVDMSVDPQGGYLFLQQIESYFASYSFGILHSIPRLFNLESFRALLAYFILQLVALVILLRHLDSDQKEIARLKAQIADLTLTPAEKKKMNNTISAKTRKTFNRVKKKIGKWMNGEEKASKSRKGKKKKPRPSLKSKGNV